MDESDQLRDLGSPSRGEHVVGPGDAVSGAIGTPPWPVTRVKGPLGVLTLQLRAASVFIAMESGYVAFHVCSTSLGTGRRGAEEPANR